jgi:hypothetical protein
MLAVFQASPALRYAVSAVACGVAVSMEFTKGYFSDRVMSTNSPIVVIA